jgi:hypothetical protein
MLRRKEYLHIMCRHFVRQARNMGLQEILILCAIQPSSETVRGLFARLYSIDFPSRVLPNSIERP